MEYTKEQFEKLQRVVDAVKDYVDNTNYMELFYGKKAGFFYIEVNPEQTRITTIPTIIKEPSKLLDCIFNSICTDVLIDSGKHHNSEEADESERMEMRRRLKYYTDLFPEYQYLADNIMKEY